MNDSQSSAITLKEIETQALLTCREAFARYDEVAVKNTEKILTAFRECQLSAFHFQGTTGYGYDDVGRETLEKVFAHVFRAEKALVRPHFVSGTHALATVLLALLNHGDEMVCAMGTPYDTMQTVIGLTGNAPGNLQERGVAYHEVATKDGRCDLTALANAVGPKTRLVLIQRSRGYAERKALTITEIEEIIRVIKAKNPQTICFVDNCYGEFTATQEPIEVGADIAAGSLIKNAGGGIAPTGSYVVGCTDLVEATAHQLTAPGLGDEMGSYTPGYRLFFEGLFMAPHVVGQALRATEFAAAVFHRLGFKSEPQLGTERSDLIQTIELGTEKALCGFCEGLQAWSPVDGYVRPVPGELPGYADPIIMACGAFTQGSSIELSADGPLRAPYTVYLQGGLVFEHSRLAIMGAAAKVLEQ